MSHYLSDPSRFHKLCDIYWDCLNTCNVDSPHRVSQDLMTWRRGSAQMVIRVNPELHNITFYSILVTGVVPSEQMYSHLLAYNALQRREALGLMDIQGRPSILMKYTLELELALPSVVQRHVLQLQEVADELDTDLASRFGGELQFDDWQKLSQNQVDDLIGSLFG
ncbi:MAG: YbjN domain-containing protein [Deltaproteobacteria bacterium]|nr:YbjN domain-containing protein [Deltaproteobacteria bacterium]